jgi:hypothetical protein
MTNQEIDQITRRVAGRVGPTPPHRPVRGVSARQLTIEFDPEPYPEVAAAFDEFCRLTGTDARLAGYTVRPVDDHQPGARVTVTVQIDEQTRVAGAVADDVVAGSVRAFAAAVARAA